MRTPLPFAAALTAGLALAAAALAQPPAAPNGPVRLAGTVSAISADSLTVKALAARDEAKAVQLMHDHLLHVEENLTFDRKMPSNDISMALS